MATHVKTPIHAIMDGVERSKAIEAMKEATKLLRQMGVETLNDGRGPAYFDLNAGMHISSRDLHQIKYELPPVPGSVGVVHHDIPAGTVDGPGFEPILDHHGSS